MAAKDAAEPVCPLTAAAATGLPLLTMALCGNKRKHAQSFDALRAEAERHNAALYKSVAAAATDVAAVASLSESGGTDEGGGCRERAAPSRLPASAAPRVFFRVVHLNYDTASRQMVLCTDLTMRGHVCSVEEPTSGPAAGGEGGDADSARRRESACASAVDVVLHKVASFATRHATTALAAFVDEAHRRRAAASRAHAGDVSARQAACAAHPALPWPRPRMVVVDEVDKVDLLTTRCMLYKLLDGEGAEGRPAALIPRTFRWERPDAVGAAPRVTPIGFRSITALDAAEAATASRANGPPGETWWIAKPDEGTGPSFTHHLVLWKSAQTTPSIPPQVHAALPREASAFVVQEYYVFSLPVVLKVYVIGPHIFVKASPTVKLLAMIERQLATQCEAVAHATDGHPTGLETPILMDSQDKDMFTASGVPTATPTPSPPMPTLAPSASGASPAAAEAVVRTVAPAAYWDAFLAAGGCAHAHIAQLAESLRAREGGLGLTLFGFDVVLVPRHLAHDFQRAACPHGIGYPTSSGGDCHAPSRPPPPPDSDRTQQPGVIAAFGPDSMFDLETGAPTPLLREAVPVVIDVNYFPGYKGMASANANILEVVHRRVEEQARQEEDLVRNGSSKKAGA